MSMNKRTKEKGHNKLEQVSKKMKTKTTEKVILYLVLMSITPVFIFPFLWTVSTSLKSLSDIVSKTPKLIPTSIVWKNYPEAWHFVPFTRFFLNSVFICSCATIGYLIQATLAAYVFARLAFPGRDMIFYVFIGCMVVPEEVLIIPLYIVISKLNLLNTYQAVILPGIWGTFGIFLLRQFFLSIPHELEDAARIDGCNRFSILWRVILPLSKPALAVLAFISFLSMWESFLWPLIVINDEKLMPLQQGLVYFISPTGTSINQMGYFMAAVVISIIPVLLAFFLAQKHFIKGMTLTGLKF